MLLRTQRPLIASAKLPVIVVQYQLIAFHTFFFGLPNIKQENEERELTRRIEHLSNWLRNICALTTDDELESIG